MMRKLEPLRQYYWRFPHILFASLHYPNVFFIGRIEEIVRSQTLSIQLQ